MLEISQIVLLVAAGTAAGLSGSVAGIASIFSYPALLLIGLNPIDANITNAVALVFISIGSITGSKRELIGRSDLIKKIAPANLIGGILGATLLLVTPSTTFQKIVPFLLALASIVILIPRPQIAEGDTRVKLRTLQILIGSIGVYCGYFGAASGAMTLAVLIQTLGVNMAKANAVKNVLLGVSNTIAAVIFIFTGHTHWAAAVPLAAGFFIGGRIGPSIVRRVPQQKLKIFVALMGGCVSVWMGIKAFS
jgi:uncharacterized membrane protein YfcA